MDPCGLWTNDDYRRLRKDWRLPYAWYAVVAGSKVIGG